MPHSAPTTMFTAPPYDVVGAVSDSARVVLYTTSFDSQIATKTLTVLRAFADAQGWTVVHELYDLAPLDTPRRHRTAWRTVEHALTTGEADGVVAPAEQEIAPHPGDRTALRVWLLDVPAFAVYPQAGQRREQRKHDEDQDSTVCSAGAPIDRNWPARSYALDRTSLRRVRSEAFTYLTILGWPGDVVAAVEVLARLADNAIRHAQPSDGADAHMDVLLAVTEDDALRIDVRDPFAEFPDSEAAVNGERGHGLWEARLLGADVTWSLAEDGRSKTVRALMVPREAPA
ncbi:ATP-binding protein [Streptomyces sp. NBC_01615]|uniref:ATP-binding protein n=1 Tax=Streptomyces sp. NBC_01615 TaxID=2975898 RepID=UPI00386997AD